MSDPVRLFIFGHGYSAGAFARAVKGRISWIGATTRSEEKAAKLAGEGIRPFVFDGKSEGAGIADALKLATHVLISVAPGEADPVLARHRAHLAASAKLKWLGYLSTVGVYGNYGGAWVSEATTPHPTSQRALERVAAERAWIKLAAERHLPLAILRLSGIYGPGRNAFVNLEEGTAHRILKPGQVFNRIHVEDIATATAAAMDQKASGIFNVTDSEPGPPGDVVTFAAELMGVKPPPEVPIHLAPLSPMARSFYAENRRVSNRRLREELGVKLRYPTYREGLTALWRTGTWRG